ncbi:glycine--tRNA ligase [Candidatus Berkelbacteria bacterium]|nr:glycine--tRNA ligase [Candidatus Berkelbacteria bacterium]
MEDLVSLAKRRGFVNQSAEIYGGLQSSWDYGPLGSLLRQNLKREWMRRFVYRRSDIVPIESTLLTKREVLQASGHEAGFTDPLVECKVCHQRFRADHDIPEGRDHKHNLTEARQFNLMFKTTLGAVEDEGSLAYFRPETAQGMFVNFKFVQEAMRMKLPFGIAQIGKAFRNEITLGHFIFRTLEFEQAEIEYFVMPAEADKHFDYWVGEWQNFFADMGIKGDRVRLRPHDKDELAHYAKAATDIEYKFHFGWSELAGVANRTDYDLKQHIEHSGKDLSWFNEEAKEKVTPYVIEPTLGVDRLFMALLVQAYHVSKGNDGRKDGEVTLKLHPRLAPVTAAVFPLVKKEGLPDLAHEIVAKLRESEIGFVQYDESGSIGRRYRRQDEIGTPYCITVDFESKDDDSVTVRHRDSLKQERVKIQELVNYLQELLKTY